MNEQTTVTIDRKTAVILDRLAKSNDVSKKEFLSCALEYFEKYGINPVQHESPAKEMQKLIKRCDQVIAFIRKQEQNILRPACAAISTCGTPAKYFVSWHEDNKDWLNDWCRKCSPDGQIREQDRALVSLLHPERLLDLIRNFIIYDNNVKKICRYKQYFAVKKCMDRILLREGLNL